MCSVPDKYSRLAHKKAVILMEMDKCLGGGGVSPLEDQANGNPPVAANEMTAFARKIATRPPEWKRRFDETIMQRFREFVAETRRKEAEERARDVVNDGNKAGAEVSPSGNDKNKAVEITPPDKDKNKTVELPPPDNNKNKTLPDNDKNKANVQIAPLNNDNEPSPNVSTLRTGKEKEAENVGPPKSPPTPECQEEIRQIAVVADVRCENNVVQQEVEKSQSQINPSAHSPIDNFVSVIDECQTDSTDISSDPRDDGDEAKDGESSGLDGEDEAELVQSIVLNPQIDDEDEDVETLETNQESSVPADTLPEVLEGIDLQVSVAACISPETNTTEAATDVTKSPVATTAGATPKEATTTNTSKITTAEATTAEVTTVEATTAEVTTVEATTVEATTAEATTAEVTTVEATTVEATTAEATTAEVTTVEATTSETTINNTAEAPATNISETTTTKSNITPETDLSTSVQTSSSKSSEISNDLPSDGKKRSADDHEDACTAKRQKVVSELGIQSETSTPDVLIADNHSTGAFDKPGDADLIRETASTESTGNSYNYPVLSIPERNGATPQPTFVVATSPQTTSGSSLATHITPNMHESESDLNENSSQTEQVTGSETATQRASGDSDGEELPLLRVRTDIFGDDDSEGNESLREMESALTNPLMGPPRSCTNPSASNNNQHAIQNEMLEGLNKAIAEILKQAQNNLESLRSLATAELRGTDAAKKVDVLNKAQDKTFKLYESIAASKIALKMQYKNFPIEQDSQQVSLSHTDIAVEDLAEYFEALLEATLLSKRPNVSDKMRGVLVVLITRIIRILGYFMCHKKEPQQSDQIFTNVNSLVMTKKELMDKYTQPNLSYHMLSFWQCVRGSTQGPAYSQGARLDHCHLGAKKFLERVNKFKMTYERNNASRQITAEQTPPINSGSSIHVTGQSSSQQQITLRQLLHPDQPNRQQQQAGLLPHQAQIPLPILPLQHLNQNQHPPTLQYNAPTQTYTMTVPQTQTQTQPVGAIQQRQGASAQQQQLSHGQFNAAQQQQQQVSHAPVNAVQQRHLNHIQSNAVQQPQFQVVQSNAVQQPQFQVQSNAAQQPQFQIQASAAQQPQFRIQTSASQQPQFQLQPNAAQQQQTSASPQQQLNQMRASAAQQQAYAVQQFAAAQRGRQSLPAQQQGYAVHDQNRQRRSSPNNFQQQFTLPGGNVGMQTNPHLTQQHLQQQIAQQQSYQQSQNAWSRLPAAQVVQQPQQQQQSMSQQSLNNQGNMAQRQNLQQHIITHPLQQQQRASPSSSGSTLQPSSLQQQLQQQNTTLFRK